MSARALPLAHALIRRGHVVKMILPPWDFPQDAGCKMQDASVEIENINLPSPWPGWFHASTTRALVKCALNFQPEVIHCFKPKAYAGLAAWWLWQLRRLGQMKARLIVDTDDWEGAGGWNDLNEYTRLQKKMFAWQEQWGLRHSDGVTVASRALQSIAWSLGVKPEKIVYIPNGASAEQTVRGERRRAEGRRQEANVLLYTRFFEFKVERVIEVLRCLVEHEPQVKLWVVGRGFHGEEERLLTQAAAIGLRGSIEYAGWVALEALPSYFARAGVAIYPFDDTLINRAKCSVKLIDLLSAGVPVVADAVGQNIEYILHGETGLLVPGGDAAAMAQAALDVLRNREQADRLGRNAARDMLERFSWDRLVIAVERSYGVAA